MGIDAVVAKINVYKFMALPWVFTKHLTCFAIFLLHAKALKLYCLKNKQKPSENSIKRLPALFMAESGFLSVNSEYGWLGCRCQVACCTPFVVSFQAAWARGPQKMLCNIKKTLGKRQKEAEMPPASHLQYIWVFWLLLQYGCFSEAQCFPP